jgi:DNA-binding CsgD family transcriptional regulator
MPAKGTGRINRERIAALIEQGLTNVQIAERIGATPEYVSQLRSGKPARSTGMVKKPCDEAKLRILCADHRLTAEQVAREMGFSHVTLYKHLRRLKIEKVRGIRRGGFIEPDLVGLHAPHDRAREIAPIGEWPAGIRFTDADVPREPMMRRTAPSFGVSLTGNGTAMAAEKGGFV